jgi:ABC-type lipoprotein export system ATPase subunit
VSVFGRRPEPHEVFTPGKPPLGEHNVYVTRTGAEADLKKYVQRGQVPVVWGEYGVGKSTLVQKYFATQEAAKKLVYVPSVAGLSLPTIFKAVLEHLEYGVIVESTTSDTRTARGHR